MMVLQQRQVGPPDVEHFRINSQVIHKYTEHSGIMC